MFICFVVYVYKVKDSNLLGNLSHSGDQLLWVDVRRRSSSVIHLLLNNYWTNFKCVVRITKKGSGQGILCNGGGHISRKVKMHYFFKNPLYYSQALIRQAKYMYVVMMIKEGSTKTVNFMTPGEVILVQRHGHISHLVKMRNLLLYSQSLIRQKKKIVIMNKKGST